MPYREIAPNTIYHIYNRATLAIPIFKSSKDYHKFITRLHEYSSKAAVEVLLYCIMPNHFHLLLREPEIGSTKSSGISTMMQKLSLSYSRHFAFKYKHSGVVFQGTFKSKPVLTDEYYYQLQKYILDNPVRKGLTNNAKEWFYSYVKPGLN